MSLLWHGVMVVMWRYRVWFYCDTVQLWQCWVCLVWHGTMSYQKYEHFITSGYGCHVMIESMTLVWHGAMAVIWWYRVWQCSVCPVQCGMSVKWRYRVWKWHYKICHVTFYDNLWCGGVVLLWTEYKITQLDFINFQFLNFILR